MRLTHGAFTAALVAVLFAGDAEGPPRILMPPMPRRVAPVGSGRDEADRLAPFLHPARGSPMFAGVGVAAVRYAKSRPLCL